MTKILVFGVGCFGVRALDYIIDSNIKNIESVATDTSSKTLDSSKAAKKILLSASRIFHSGKNSIFQDGINAAKESLDEIKERLKGADIVFVFVIAEMGKGIETGATLVIAEAARDMGILVIGIAIKPFSFQNDVNMQIVEDGIKDFKRRVDSIITLQSDRIIKSEYESAILEAYKKVYEVIMRAVQCIADIIKSNGLVKLDFEDIRAVFEDAGTSIIGIGEGEGEDRIKQAVHNAIYSPLMELPVAGARGILLTITTDGGITLDELGELQKFIDEIADPDAYVIYSHSIDNSLGEKARVSLIATFPDYITIKNPVTLPNFSRPHLVSNGNFNIFEILSRNDELEIICRFLYELFSPNGCHGMGIFFLKTFLIDLLNFKISEFDLISAKISYSANSAIKCSKTSIGITSSCHSIYLWFDVNEIIAKGIYFYFHCREDNTFICCRIPRKNGVHLRHEEVKNINIQEFITWLSNCLKQSGINNNLRGIISDFIRFIKNLSEIKPCEKVYPETLCEIA